MFVLAASVFEATSRIMCRASVEEQEEVIDLVYGVVLSP
jgi:hypothetical protein